jgi:hypothetical protein
MCFVTAPGDLLSTSEGVKDRHNQQFHNEPAGKGWVAVAALESWSDQTPAGLTQGP